MSEIHWPILKTMKHTLTLLTALLLAPLTALHAADATKPNIIVILSDDMGYSDIGCYGSEISTPSLEGAGGQMAGVGRPRRRAALAAQTSRQIENNWAMFRQSTTVA